jgi:hypothetical protein
MKIYKITIAVFIGALLFTSCKKALDKVDLSKGTASIIFGDSTLVKQNIDYIYDQNLPVWYGNDGGAMFSVSGGISGLSDESYGDNKFLQGIAINTDVGDIGVANSNSNTYGKIRIINTFIRDCSAGTLAAGVKRRFLAQAYFFRAYRYFQLVRVYGGVPLVLTPLPSVGDAKNEAALPRSKTSECFKQIASDLDSAIKYLPVKWPQSNDWGRVTSGAAAAFKGRVLLTYASPQFNPANDVSRWQAAYDVNTLANNLLKSGGFGLNSSYQNMWFTEVNNPEAVLVTGFNNSTAQYTSKNNTYDKSVRPAYLGAGSSSSQPSWDFVQDYPMLDGKAPGVSTKYSYSLQTFYKNRDPRFEATVAYNGCLWPILGNNSYRLWTYLYYTDDNGTKSSSTEITGATNTGFYLRKAVNSSVDASNVQYSGTDWMEIRYAEVLLNLGECAAELNKLGQGEEAYSGIVAIRKRAGIEAGSDGLYGLDPGMTHDQMINAIMREREIEFSFEGKRFWDLRRRNLLLPLLNNKKTRLGLTIVLKNTGSKSDYIKNTRETAPLDDLYSNTFTITTRQLDTKYNLNWQPNYSFFAIPPSTIANDPNILQTKGWDNGSFDPLQ